MDYIIAPLKVLQSLKESDTTPEEKYSFVGRLSPHSAATYNFSEEEVCFLSIFYSLFPRKRHEFFMWERIEKLGNRGEKKVDRNKKKREERKSEE